MKKPSQVNCVVVDYGNFLSLAAKLGETYRSVLYYSPHETEYRDVAKCVTGEGVAGVTRIEEYLHPDIVGEADLFVFPDIGFAGVQRYLESIGKAVWGSREVTEIELKRSLFLDVLEQQGLPRPPSKVVKGLAALEAMLEKVEDKWIKLDIYRENMETWHHIDYEHSLPMLRYLATTFGGVSEEMVFVVQDTIPDAQENGYDGFSVNGKFPDMSFQGYEKKNELYLGTWQHRDELPKEVRHVNERMASLLRRTNYRNFFATELRNEFFIDPTPRMAGQSQEHLLETCTNLADIIWAGANGKLIEPEFKAKFAASATLHYKEVPGEHWKSVKVPAKVSKWFKLANYAQDGEIYNFPPGRNDEIGVVIGYGDSIEAAIGELKSHLEVVEKEPICAEVEGFVDLLKDIHKAQAAGIKFSDQPLPPPESVVA